MEARCIQTDLINYTTFNDPYQQWLVVHKLDHIPINAFFLILLLLHLENVLVKEELQLFIGQVDAGLFKAVFSTIFSKVFKSKNV